MKFNSYKKIDVKGNNDVLKGIITYVVNDIYFAPAFEAIFRIQDLEEILNKMRKTWSEFKNENKN